jgi:hypothetical protein
MAANTIKEYTGMQDGGYFSNMSADSVIDGNYKSNRREYGLGFKKGGSTKLKKKPFGGYLEESKNLMPNKLFLANRKSGGPTINQSEITPTYKKGGKYRC